MNSKLVKGSIWVSLSAGIQAIVRFSVMLILARLIGPEEFGIIGITVMLGQFAIMLSEAGVAAALVQRKSLNTDQVNAGFTIALVVGIVAALLMNLNASSLATYFNEPMLTNAFEAYSVIFLLSGIATVYEAGLYRELNFKAVGIVELFSHVVGYGIVAVLLALNGYGFWSLLLAHIAYQFLRLFGLKLISPFQFSQIPFKNAYRDIASFGVGHTLSKLFNFIATQIDTLFIGRYLGVYQLGLYGRAMQLSIIPMNVLGMVVDKLTFPLVARYQDDYSKVKHGFLATINFSLLVNGAMSVTLFLFSEQVIVVLLGSDWLAAEPILQLMALALVFRGAHKVFDPVTRGYGTPYLRATIHGIYALLSSVFVYIGAQTSVEYVAIGVLLATAINCSLMAILALRSTKISINEFFRSTVGSIIFIFLLALLVIFIQHVVNSMFSSAMLQLGFGLIATIFCSLVLILLMQRVGIKNTFIALLVNSYFSNKKLRLGLT